MSNFKIFIDNREIETWDGETVLIAAHRNGIEIPALCYHCDIKPHESCRLCMVEVEGDKNLRTSCSLPVKPDMRVNTSTDDVKRTLKTNLELLFAQHRGKCLDCKRKNDCKLTLLAREYEIEGGKYTDRKRDKLEYQFGPSIEFDPKKCINCENCSEICAGQTNGGFIRPRESKYNFEVGPSMEKDHDCIYCGQCVMHCPVGALSEKEDYKEVIKLLKDKKKKVVFQFAPAIRTALGEEFSMPLGTNVTDKIYAAFKKMGAYKAFDASFAADVTIMEEAHELIEKIEKGDNSVMLSSCCPAWVKYIEFYEPSLMKYLTTVRSPQIILGGLIKTYWAKEEKISPKDIVVVSIMPCTAKKFEITRKELLVDGMRPVDIVLTTRELAKLIKSFKIDFAALEGDESSTEIMANPTGAGEIFGASGGVLEAALRTVYFKLTGNNLEQLEFAPLHEFTGVKTVEVEIAGKKIAVAAVSGIKNVKDVIKELKSNIGKFAYLEVMACPGGCIGGGGQPIPIDNEIRKARADGLYKTDRDRKLRLSHENPGVIKLYDEFLGQKKNEKKVCLSSYRRKRKGKLIKK